MTEVRKLHQSVPTSIMLRFIKNKKKRGTGSNVDLIKVVMPMGETIPADIEKKEVKDSQNPDGYEYGKMSDPEPSSPLYAELNPASTGNPEHRDTQGAGLGLDLDDLLKEVENDLKDLTRLSTDNAVDLDVIYAKPQRPPSKPPRQNLKVCSNPCSLAPE